MRPRRRDSAPFDRTDTVGEKCQRPPGCNPRIELAQAPGRGVTRVDENLFAGGGLRGIHRREVAPQHQHLAADLEIGREIAGERQRQRAHRPQVGADVLAGVPVAARRADAEYAVFVRKADRQAVELGLGRVFDPLDTERLARAPVEGLDLAGAEGIVQRQHRQAVRDRVEFAGRLGADPLRWRIGGRERRILVLQRLKLAKRPVVLGIAHRRRIEHVIGLVVRVDCCPQRGRALGDLRGDGGARRHGA